MTQNRLEYIRPELLEDLGFYRTERDDLSWTHMGLVSRNLTLCDFGNGCWHFVVRNTCQGIGKMIWLDDLLLGFEFVTGESLL